ncbi:MAG: HAD family hydrolase [Anaerolineaceae bacterium]|nr:HAD family hydrolase [Anaerolineaceae bacterium]
MISIPILCFDLDGTLLDGQGRIHPSDVAILSGGTGALLVPTTGRPLSSVRNVFARHGLFTDRPIPLPLVLQNGAALYLPGERLQAYTPFKRDVQAALLSLAHGYHQVTFLFLDQSSIDVLWPHPFAERAAQSYDFITQPFSTTNSSKAYSKMMCVSASPAGISGFYHQTAGIPVERAYSMPTVLEITPPGINKGKGVEQLLATLGLERSPIYAAGDGGNDLALFELARRSFAPGNSPELVRSAADQLVNTGENGLLTPMLQASEQADYQKRSENP